MKFRLAIIISCFLIAGSQARLWAQNSDCNASIIIPEADRKYRLGNFEEALGLLNPCLKSGFSQNAMVQAYKIIALTYLALDSLPQAAHAVRDLLNVNQNYEPEFSSLPQFKNLVLQQKELQEKILNITSVSKKAENLLQVPATVTVITKDDILKRGYRDLSQMLYDLSGLDVIKTNGTGYIIFYQRGYRSTGIDRTIVLVDGVEENDLSSDNVQFSRQYSLSDIERVEIIYGPASTMYGANAFTGVINIITRKLMEKEMAPGKKIEFTTRGRLNYASMRTRAVDWVASARTKDFAVSVTTRFFASNERDLSRYPEWNFDKRTASDYATRLNISGEAATEKYLTDKKITALYPNSTLYQLQYAQDGKPIGIALTPEGQQKAADLDNQYVFDANIQGSTVQYNDYSYNAMVRAKVEFSDFTLSYLGWTLDEGATPWYSNQTRISNRHLSRWVTSNKAFSLTYNKVVNERVQLLNLTSYRIHEIGDKSNFATYSGYFNKRYEIIDLLKERKPTYSVPSQYRVSNQLRNESRILWKPISILDINSGVEIRNSIIQANYITSVYGDASEIGRPDSTLAGGDNFKVFDVGLFSQASIQLNRQFKFVLGGRLDRNQIRKTGGYGFAFNPRIATIYTAGRFIFKGIYAEAFKDASYLQKYATTAERKLNNPTLQPEKVKNMELSAFVRIAKGLTLNLAGYRAIYSGAVTEVTVSYPGGGTTKQFQTSGRQRILGLQGEARYEMKKLDLWCNFTATNPLDLKDGKKVRVSDIARYSFNAGGSYSVTDALVVSLSNHYTGARETGLGTSGSTNPKTRFDPFFVMNFSATYQGIFKHAGLQLQVTNLLNNEYFVPGTRGADGVSAASYFPQDLRVASISLLLDLN